MKRWFLQLETYFPKALVRLFSYVGRHKMSIAFALMAMIAAGAASSLIALLLGKLTDIGFYQQDQKSRIKAM